MGKTSKCLRRGTICMTTHSGKASIKFMPLYSVRHMMNKIGQHQNRRADSTNSYPWCSERKEKKEKGRKPPDTSRLTILELLTDD